MEQSIYEKYGGFASINKVVMSLYDVLLDSDELGPYFDDVDMPKLIDHQTKFIAYLLGGPASFTDDHLKRAHTRLNISDDHFNEMKLMLAGVLSDAGFESEDVDLVMAAVENHRTNVVV